MIVQMHIKYENHLVRYSMIPSLKLLLLLNLTIW